MKNLLAALEAIPDGEMWHVSLGSEEYVLSDFEAVDPSIYGKTDVVLANVVRKISGAPGITSKNKIEFELSQLVFVKSVDGAITLFSRAMG